MPNRILYVAWAQPRVSFYYSFSEGVMTGQEAKTARDKIRKLKQVAFVGKENIKTYPGPTGKVTLNRLCWNEAARVGKLLLTLQEIFNVTIICEELTPVTMQRTRVRHNVWLSMYR